MKKEVEEPKEQKFMSVKDFREKGYLQEANRLFFHPLGLALEVNIDEGGNETIGRIWDEKRSKKGILFAKGRISEEKANFIAEEFEKKRETRSKLADCGMYGVQNLET